MDATGATYATVTTGNHITTATTMATAIAAITEITGLVGAMDAVALAYTLVMVIGRVAVTITDAITTDILIDMAYMGTAGIRAGGTTNTELWAGVTSAWSVSGSG